MADELRDAFLNDVADAVRYWRHHVKDKLAHDRAVTDVVEESLGGLAHSILVILDGGTKLSDHGRRVWLTDSDGELVSEGLHEYLPDHLDG